MTFFILLTLISSSVLVFLFSRHLAEIKKLEIEEIERKIREQPSPFHEIEERAIIPAKIWFSRQLPFFAVKAGEFAVKETRRALLRLASSLGGVHDYLRGRKIYLSAGRKSAYWTEIQDEIKSGGSNDKKTPE